MPERAIEVRRCQLARARLYKSTITTTAAAADSRGCSAHGGWRRDQSHQFSALAPQLRQQRCLLVLATGRRCRRRMRAICAWALSSCLAASKLSQRRRGLTPFPQGLHRRCTTLLGPCRHGLVNPTPAEVVCRESGALSAREQPLAEPAGSHAFCRHIRHPPRPGSRSCSIGGGRRGGRDG